MTNTKTKNKTTRKSVNNKSAATSHAQTLIAYFTANKTICNQTIWHRYCAPAKMANTPTPCFSGTARASNNRFKRVFCCDANRPHVQIKAYTIRANRKNNAPSIRSCLNTHTRVRYRCVTSVLCLYLLFRAIIDRLPFATPSRYAVFSKNFF